MDYAKVENNLIVSGRIEAKFVCKKCNVSFANGAEKEILREFGYLPVVDIPPEYDPTTQERTVAGIYQGDSVPEGATHIEAVYTISSKTAVQLALDEIELLEKEITPRRTREAVLGVDGGWLSRQESLIATQRSKI